MWWNDYWHGPWMLFGPGMMIIFVIVCFALMAFMMRGTAQRPAAGRALEILRERYARGEINETEFEQRRRLLEQS
jgi:putative membrane protein